MLDQTTLTGIRTYVSDTFFYSWRELRYHLRRCGCYITYSYVESAQIYVIPLATFQKRYHLHRCECQSIIWIFILQLSIKLKNPSETNIEFTFGGVVRISRSISSFQGQISHNRNSTNWLVLLSSFLKNVAENSNSWFIHDVEINIFFYSSYFTWLNNLLNDFFPQKPNRTFVLKMQFFGLWLQSLQTDNSVWWRT